MRNVMSKKRERRKVTEEKKQERKDKMSLFE